MDFKQILVKQFVKSVIISILTTALSVCTASLGDWSAS